MAFIIALSRPKTQKTNKCIDDAHTWRGQAVYFTLSWFWYSRTPFARTTNPSQPLQASDLDLDGGLKRLLTLLLALLGLEAHDTTTPALAGILDLLEVAFLDSRDELGKLVLVLRADLSDGNNGSSLAMCQT
jgi:hypothetical protein